MRIRDDVLEDELALNLTPMIDVVFLLLVFFLVATTFLDPERQLDVDLPVAETGSEPGADPDEIVVHVDREGVLRLGGDVVERDALLAHLRAAAQRDPATPVTIRGHREARHQAIVSVMDACGLAGLTNLAVGTTADEGQG